MPQKLTTFLDELTQAARGCAALLTGNRQAATFFDFSQRGLVGSIIALLIASAVTAYGPQLFGVEAAPGTATRALILDALFFSLQIGIGYIVLRQLGREDGFIPFLVADNWATFFTSLLSLGLLPFGGPNMVLIFAIGIALIIVEVNIARLIVTLAPLQIALFIIAQLVGSAVGLMILVALMPDAGGAVPAV